MRSADAHGFLWVMGDVDHRRPTAAEDRAQLGAASAQLGVEVAHRFIEQGTTCGAPQQGPKQAKPEPGAGRRRVGGPPLRSSPSCRQLEPRHRGAGELVAASTPGFSIPKRKCCGPRSGGDRARALKHHRPPDGGPAAGRLMSRSPRQDAAPVRGIRGRRSGARAALCRQPLGPKQARHSPGLHRQIEIFAGSLPAPPMRRLIPSNMATPCSAGGWCWKSCWKRSFAGSGGTAGSTLMAPWVRPARIGR